MFDRRHPAGRFHDRLMVAVSLAGIALVAAPASAAPPDSKADSTVAAQAVLFEESPDNPLGSQLAGSVTWRTEMLTPAPGEAPELVVRGDIQIPGRRLNATWTLRRNTDKKLPASHTIEIVFRLPANFPGGNVDNVPGMLMKTGETTRGTPLAGLAVKVANGFFLFGLSADDGDRKSNMRMLKELAWFDVPMIYKSGRRAILALEKGPSGDRAFADAFAAWAN
jgi:hypothetical protein